MRRAYYEGLARQGELMIKAREWIGTPFKAHARALGVGVDCVNLMAEIYKVTGLVDGFAPGSYSMDSGAHAERSQVIDYVEGTGKFDLVWEIGSGRALQLQIGDLLCFQVGKQVHHVGMAMGPLKFLHVYRGYRVKESLVDDPTWRKRLARVYRPVTD